MTEKLKATEPSWWKPLFWGFLFILGIGALIASIWLTKRGEKVPINITIIFIVLPIIFTRLFYKDPLKFYGLQWLNIKKTHSAKFLFLLLLLLIIFASIDIICATFVPEISETMKKPEVSKAQPGIAVAKAVASLPAGLFVLIGLFISLIDTFAEEIWFRGIIQGLLFKIRNKVLSLKFKPRILVFGFSPWILVFIQGLIFGLVHFKVLYPLGPEFTPLAVFLGAYATLFGFVAGWLLWKTKSILLGFYLHFAINFITMYLARTIW